MPNVVGIPAPVYDLTCLGNCGGCPLVPHEPGGLLVDDGIIRIVSLPLRYAVAVLLSDAVKFLGGHGASFRYTHPCPGPTTPGLPSDSLAPGPAVPKPPAVVSRSPRRPLPEAPKRL